jgi:hypothetical protein
MRRPRAGPIQTMGSLKRLQSGVGANFEEGLDGIFRVVATGVDINSANSASPPPRFALFAVLMLALMGCAPRNISTLCQLLGVANFASRSSTIPVTSTPLTPVMG